MTIAELQKIAQDRQESRQNRVNALRTLAADERLSPRTRIEAADAARILSVNPLAPDSTPGAPGNDDDRYNEYGDDDHDGFESFDDIEDARERALGAVALAQGSTDLVAHGESYPISDLVTNLLHLADRHGFDPADILDSALRQFDAARFDADGRPLRASGIEVSA